MDEDSRTSPAQSDYERRMASEQATYADCLDVHELPAIFHYWSNRYLRPKFEPFGFSDPNDFFRVYLERLCRAPGRRDGPLSFVSIGAGNGDVEVGLARSLLDAGHDGFRLECMDINEDMLERGRQAASEHGVSEHMDFRRGDFNDWRPEGEYDAVIANQCLHHVLELERLFERIRASLRPDGFLLVSDMIGRNGHMRWPEALAMVEAFWEELPGSKRYNHQLRRQEDEFVNHDCSEEGFEGIRAQDILPLLRQRFHFELFVPFANVIDVFIDRGFGHNFDPDDEADRAFIDRVHAADEEAMLKGRITPTHMVAALTTVRRGRMRRPNHLTPRRCVRPPDGRYGIRTRLSRWLAGMTLAGLLVLAGCGAEQPPEPPPNPLADHLPVEPGYNVVVISFDALRADALGTYGYHRPTSPRIDEFAAQSLVFEQASVAGQATPTSFASAFTGELPFRVFRGWNLEHVPTLAAAFRDAGYATAGIMNNVQVMPERGFDQGFEHYEVLEEPRDRRVVERVAGWLDDGPERPFFLWAHFITPHTPYTYRDFAEAFYDPGYEGPLERSSGEKLKPEDTPTEADRKQLRDLYDGEVLFADRLFGEMEDLLKAHDAWDDTIVVLTSDHGEEFLDHGGYGHHTLHREVLRVPLIIRHPGAGAPGRTDMRYLSTDLFPTLASLVDVPYPDYIDGVSLVRSPWAGRPLVYVAMTGKTYRALAVRVRDDKLIVECSRPGGAKPVNLYDLAEDPAEQRDLIDQRPETVEALFAHLQDAAGEKPCDAIYDALAGKSMEEGLDDERIEQLRSLGYIQ